LEGVEEVQGSQTRASYGQNLTINNNYINKSIKEQKFQSLLMKLFLRGVKFLVVM
jgi:hypothetical protein